MAKMNNKTTMFFNFLLVLSFLLVISMAESRSIFGIGIGKPTALICDKIYGAESGDSCFSVTQKFNLTTEFFSQMNPNLVCGKMFVGEWLCIDGSA
ncbi:hypothetical protein Acr_18g0006590 [Actinidia rufa]|uniref:LysM domain-containing protein n=1 Tax=Actinidia rufa TaxID=165716 RepID=A0A7J0G6T8_9ERIC|nr:hypothetical protein Acr_18g0006590 [Actinidia rufa]